MNNYFLAKIKFEKTAEEGKVVKVSEQYLVDALSFTEAEQRIIKEMEPFISGEFEVSAISRSRLNEIFFDETGDRWYKSKIVFIQYNEEKQKDVRTAATMYAQACSIEDARGLIAKRMKGSMADYEIESIIETKILDVFKYEAE